MKRILWILLCLGLMDGPLLARQTPVRTELVGLRPASNAGILSLTLDDAVRLAVENNPTLKVEKIRVEQARSRVDGERGEFHPLLNSSTNFLRRDNIIASRFYPTGLYTDVQQSANIGLEGRTHTGGKLTFTLSYAQLRSSSNTQTLSPQYSTNFVLNFTHALLRDFGRSIVETRLRVAEKGALIAENNLFSRISQMIQRVEETYWNLTFLLRDLDEKKRSLESAREFLTQNENLLRAGRVAPVSVTQARAGVAEREEAVIRSQTSVDQYKDRLKTLLWLDLATTDVTPVEGTERQPPGLDAAKALETAVLRRPEILALQRELEERQLELKFAGNQKRPRLDLTAQYGNAGLAGFPNPTCIDPTSPLCIPVGSNVAGSILVDKTARSDAFKDLVARNPFENWSVELKFQLPLGSTPADAQYAEAALRQLETETNLAAMKDQISIEIRSAVRDALAAQKRIEAAREVIVYVEDQLIGMRQQLGAGLVSSYDVIKALDEVDRAKTTELQALMDYNVSLSKVRLAEASGFFRYNIDLAQAPRYTFQPGPIR
ncbi:MAG TPA: TolC family protein [Terriglobia bacterium]|nr:TolC family protein [Terriglobia bacterium]